MFKFFNSQCQEYSWNKIIVKIIDVKAKTSIQNTNIT